MKMIATGHVPESTKGYIDTFGKGALLDRLLPENKRGDGDRYEVVITEEGMSFCTFGDIELGPAFLIRWSELEDVLTAAFMAAGYASRENDDLPEDLQKIARRFFADRA